MATPLPHAPPTAPRCTRRALRRARGVRGAKPALLARLATLVLALGVLGLMAYGERWMLQHPATAGTELIVSRCVVDVVFGTSDRTDACTSND